MRPTRDTLKLPAKLVDEIGGRELLEGRRKYNAVNARKQKRKAERAQKKVQRSGPPPKKKVKTQHFRLQDGDHHDSKLRPPPGQSNSLEIGSSLLPNSILRSTKRKEISTAVPDKATVLPLSPIKLSRAVRDRLAEDDKEIAALEKRLGIKGKNGLPRAFKDDGLDEILAGLDEEKNGGLLDKEIQDTEGRDWLSRKRRKLSLQLEAKEANGNIDTETKDEGEEENDFLSSDVSLDERSDRALIESDSDDEFEGFESDSTKELPPSKRLRENPYVPPSTSGSSAPAKYIPRPLRTVSDESRTLQLRRQIQGLVNRLTEANLLSILGEIETLFMENARQHVTSTLVDLLLTSVCEPSILPDTLIILPAGFIAAIYKVIGTDFGAHVVQRVVELFDQHYVHALQGRNTTSARTTSNTSKEASNLIALLAQLYNFQVVGSNLMFDYIRRFLEVFTELNAELLLKIIRTSGSQLRHDDPSSLKDVINMIQPAVAIIGDSNISVRTKFMIETINGLKNNRLKTGAAASAVTSEHTIRMKRMLGALNGRTIKATEPLRIGLKDLQESKKRGKWWLVGASWTGSEIEGEHGIQSSTEHDRSTGELENHDVESGAVDLVRLAKDQRMNTDIRRAIFVSIMSADDYQDAHSRLLKLRLKKAQELEIPRVLMHCSGAEQSYNPYYTLIARKLCGDRRQKMAFQFSLWDLFTRFGENDNGEENAHRSEDEDGEEDPLDTRRVVNLAKMFGSLICYGALSLMVLKNLDLHYLQHRTKTFVEIVCITMFTQSQRPEIARDEAAVVNLVSKVKDSQPLTMGIKYFLRRVVINTDIIGSKVELATIKWACKVACDFLEESS